jgi:hypothetical protein
MARKERAPNVREPFGSPKASAKNVVVQSIARLSEQRKQLVARMTQATTISRSIGACAAVAAGHCGEDR